MPGLCSKLWGQRREACLYIAGCWQTSVSCLAFGGDGKWTIIRRTASFSLWVQRFTCVFEYYFKKKHLTGNGGSSVFVLVASWVLDV